MRAASGHENRLRASALAVALTIVAAATAGCGRRTDSAERLGDRTGARLTAGTGLDDIRLGQTTLGAFAERFGDGRPAYFAGDEYGVELTFEGGQFGFLFRAEGAALDRLQKSTLSDVTRALIPISEFVRSYPECAGMRLHSVHVAAGSDAESTLFTGATERGVRLFSTEVDVLTAYGRPHDLRGLLVSGSDEKDDRYRTAAYRDGVQFYLSAPREGGQRVVEKIAIFPPQGPEIIQPDR